MRPQPPKWIFRLLAWYCHPDYANEITGDLQELFEQWVRDKGLYNARLRYTWNAVLFLRLYNSRFSQNSTSMTPFRHFNHYIKVSVRNLFRYRVFHAGNILGLAFGLGVSYLILIHVDRELSYEKHIDGYEHIFRVATHQDWAKSSVMLGEKLTEYFPETESVCRLARYSAGVTILSSGQRQTTAEDLFQADTTVIDMFGLRLLVGADQPLHRPFTAMISETLARKLYGDQSAIGEVFQVNDQQSFEITAVYQDIPETSHFQAQVLLSMDTFYENTPAQWVNNPGWMVMYTYVKMRTDINSAWLQGKMPDFQKYYVPEEYWDEIGNNYFEVMPLEDIHLKSDRIQEMGENSDITYVLIFGSLALFILMIASVNFVNIFTAIGLRRIREIGVRKLVGASRPTVIGQLLFESVLSATIGLVIAVMIGLVLLPWYNQAMGMDLGQEIMFRPKYMWLLAGIALLIGTSSGFYPAWLISGQDPLQSVARNEQPKATISYFRKGLITLQFTLSLMVFIGGLVIRQQMAFMGSQDLGYDQENLINIRTYGDLRQNFSEQAGSIRQRMKDLPGVLEVGRVSSLVGEPLSYESFALANQPEQEGTVNMLWGDELFLKTMKISLLEGESFHVLDSGTAFIVNQSLAEQLGGDVVGQMANWRDQRGPIVGVMQDFHHYSLKSGVEPTALAYRPEWAAQWLVRLQSEDTYQTLSQLEALVHDVAPNAYFLAGFLDQKVQSLYRGERQMLEMVSILTLLALVISGVGLLGVASVEIHRRRKEIGIRKVLGASGAQVIRALGRQFLIMAVIAVIVAIPVSLWFAASWLANFTVQMNLTIWLFLLPTLAILLIIAGIVISQTIPILRNSPSLALRKE